MHRPNIIIPLANSYNNRGVAGFTDVVTNSVDQRKINCMYEVATNPITGARTLYLAKRPGVTAESGSYGSTTQEDYLIHVVPGSGIGDANRFLFNVSGGSVRASTSSGDTTIVSATGSVYPMFVDRTLISAVENIVLQTGAAPFTGSHRTFYRSSGSWSEITDADYTAQAASAVGKMEHMDGYAFQLISTNNIINSDLNSLSSWTATSFLAKQIVQDRALGLARLNNQILAFGETTVEMFYNAGNASGSPLSPIRQLHRRIGLVPTNNSGSGVHYYATVGDRLYFVGRRGGGAASVGVFAYDGSNFEKVSTSFIDRILGESVLYAVHPIGFNGQQAVTFRITIQSSATARFLVYFPEWKEWFEWTSAVFMPGGDPEYMIGQGSSTRNKIHKFSASDNYQDNGTSYAFSTQFKLPASGPERKRMLEFGVIGDTARSANTLTVEASDDDYQTWSTLATVDLTQVRKTHVRGGTYIDRAIRLGNTNALETRLQSFTALVK